MRSKVPADAQARWATYEFDRCWLPAPFDELLARREGLSGPADRLRVTGWWWPDPDGGQTLDVDRPKWDPPHGRGARPGQLRDGAPLLISFSPCVLEEIE